MEENNTTPTVEVPAQNPTVVTPESPAPVVTQEPQGDAPTQVNTDHTIVPETKKPNVPQRLPDESEARYSARTNLSFAQEALNNAETEEERNFAKEQLKMLRGELASLSRTEKKEVQQPVQPVFEGDDAQQVEAWLSSKFEEMAKTKGLMTREDFERESTQKLISQREVEQEAAINKFASENKQIFQNKVAAQELMKYVKTYFRIDEKSTGNDLYTALDMAKVYLFPTQNLSSKVAEAQNKVAAMNITGSNAPQSAKGILSDAEKAKYRTMGYSEEDIARLDRLHS